MSSSISAKQSVDESICVERKIKPRTIDLLKLSPGLQQRGLQPRRVAPPSASLSVFWPCSVGPGGGRGRAVEELVNTPPQFSRLGGRDVKKKSPNGWSVSSISPLAGRSNSCCAPASDSASLGSSAGKSKLSLFLQPRCHVNVMGCKFRWKSRDEEQVCGEGLFRRSYRACLQMSKIQFARYNSPPTTDVGLWSSFYCIFMGSV